MLKGMPPLFNSNDFQEILGDAHLIILRDCGWLMQFDAMLLKKEQAFTEQLINMQIDEDAELFKTRTMAIRLYIHALQNMRSGIKERLMAAVPETTDDEEN